LHASSGPVAAFKGVGGRTLHQRSPPTESRFIRSWGSRRCSRSVRLAPRCSDALGDEVVRGLNEDQVGQVLKKGDLVIIKYKAFTEDGNLLEEADDLSLELGSGDVVGNPLFKAFDDALRSKQVGDRVECDIQGGEWKPELLFKIPTDHQEVQRLKMRYEKQGGLQRGMLVELANGAGAIVLEVNEEEVQLDCNNMLAGTSLRFVLDVLRVEEEGFTTFCAPEDGSLGFPNLKFELKDTEDK